MELFKTPNIKFLKYKYIALAVTAAIVLAGILNVTLFHGLKPGVDFGGGTLIRIMLKSPIPIDEVRDQLASVGLGGSTIQETENKGEYMIRTMQVVKTADAQEEMEAHEKLADSVIAALKGDDGRSELAGGLIDLNDVQAPALASLIDAGFPGKGEEAAGKIIGLRVKNGIIHDFSELQGAGIDSGMVSFLKDKTFVGKMTVISRETVGPQVGKDLRKKAAMATIWALMGMLVYIAFRFKLEYGVAAIFTLAQDVLITMTIYSFTNREINLPIIAGILTIVGYSINDTIVIFDRVRENSKIYRKESLEEVMNISLNQTLGRTIITSGTLLLTLIALYFFGGKVINDFAFIMLIGTIEGIYSTIALSCPVVLFWQKLFKTKKGFRR